MRWATGFLVAVFLMTCGTTSLAGQQRDMGELQKAAEGGKVEAQFEMGLAYWSGDGVPVNEPEAAKWFGKVARMVGSEDRGRIERAIRHSDFRALAEMEKRDGFVEVPIKGKRFFRAGRSNQWREKLSREQVARIVAAHREQMQRFGYVPGGY